MDYEQEFADLADELCERAAGIECPAAEYRAGLRAIIERLKTEIQASKETDDEEVEA